MDTRIRAALIGSAALGVALLASLTALGWRAGHVKGLDDFGAAPSFALTDQLERPTRSEELRGRVVLASFIYTSCRDICPVLSLRMQHLQGQLREARLLDGRVQLLSLTVDPERDTPAVLRSYAERHQADPDAWRFLTGPADQLIALIVDGFRLGVDVLPPDDAHSTHGANAAYDVTHSGRFVLIDRRVLNDN